MPVRVTLITLAAALGAAAPAVAARPEGCPPDPDVVCSRVEVPRDRADPARGNLKLLVARRPADERRRATLLVLAGGPGESAISSFGATLQVVGSAIMRRNDVVSFDARGTGGSEVVVCRAMQRDLRQRSTTAAADCAEQLGPRRGDYTAAAQVEDIEAVRRALRLPRLDLYGTSFGTKVALQYAQRHPQRVGRLLLDSVLAPSGPSAIGAEVAGALPRVLAASCPPRSCRVSRDLLGDVRDLVARLRTVTTRGTVYDQRGRARRVQLGPVTLLDLLLEGDFVPVLRDALPAAIAAARDGDPAPLLRLSRLDINATPRFAARDFSSGAYAAGSCEDVELPWDPNADADTRAQQALDRLERLGPEALDPFDAQTILQADYLSLCRAWPAPVRPPEQGTDALPDVPMLLVEGEQDLRTPLEGARALVRGRPSARLLSVPRVGHAVLVSDPTPCSRRVARRFLLRLPVDGARCPGPPADRAPGVPPRSLRAVRGVAGLPPVIGKTLHAVDLTLDDLVTALRIGAPAGGGLRGGAFRVTAAGLVLDRYSYVPGVTVSFARGDSRTVTLRIGGGAAARGQLVLSDDGAFRGRLAGKRVRGRLSGGAPDP